ncbi:alpha/beta fold hydrolase [Deinococcus roseus]|uniref:Alpha/beta hydrolase n=1 Tax=Deinococcus roseus TaxID=392414 RepID=A0ABQ2DD31_9DEIO|nr:alpha/beta hydrolase [Deinococcus roseus]GGJ51656.1 alpha/beta hydrolase [Deinococcus roseus]
MTANSTQNISTQNIASGLQILQLSAGLTLTVQILGQGSPVLLLHGGGGPQVLQVFAQRLAQRHQVFIPIHPGFSGTHRPEQHNTIKDLAATYATFLQHLNLQEVVVMGFSMGGWIASELVLHDSSRIGKLVLVNAVGIEVPGHPVTDVFNVTPAELARLSFHRPEAVQQVPLTPELMALRAANFATLALYDQNLKMADPNLHPRLSEVQVPVLVTWGESDGIVDLTYGQAYAAAFPQAQFVTIPEAGHQPQVEQPDRLLTALQSFLQ